MKFTDTMTDREQSFQFSLGSTLVGAATLKMEFSLAILEKSVDIDGVLDRPAIWSLRIYEWPCCFWS